MHIIRNAVDHGIEPPDERKRLGKPALGSITLSVYNEKNRVAVVISDNGRGIDRRQVLAKAAQKGIPAERLMSLTGKEVLSLICLPGLSTKEGISETSGRGVGMDAVKSAIEALGGSLDIESESGKGTKITLDLPRTTSIIKALSVRVSDEMFLLPLSGVVKVVEADAKAASGASFVFEGASIPLMPLASAVGLEETAAGRFIPWWSPGQGTTPAAGLRLRAARPQGLRRSGLTTSFQSSTRISIRFFRPCPGSKA